MPRPPKVAWGESAGTAVGKGGRAGTAGKRERSKKIPDKIETSRRTTVRRDVFAAGQAPARFSLVRNRPPIMSTAPSRAIQVMGSPNSVAATAMVTRGSR